MHMQAAALALATACRMVLAVDPRTVPLTSTKCSAPNRATGVTKDIEIKYVDINPQAERTLLMVHGWPGLWHVWREQIEAFKDDYHIVAVNQRGFGGSEHPGDLETSNTMGDLTGDLTCVLAHAKVEKAICVGHDWGSQVCHEAARMRPDIFDGVIGYAIPYLPYDSPFTPMSRLIKLLPTLSYNLYFSDKTAQATVELNRDVRRTLRATLRTVNTPPPTGFLRSTDSFLRAWDTIEVIPPIPFFSKDEENYWVEQFEAHGFNYTFGFYTAGTRYGSWALVQSQGNQTIPQPVLSILPTSDPVADWVSAAKLLKSADHTPQLTVKTTVAAHWLQMEKSAEVNVFMQEWLDVHYPVRKRESEEEKHKKDEL
ncbi:alpha/beta-hydrolase [Cytidiella melzeri]|nr:alpha/beta-hydrolase [Cytidiella melzeri]